LVLDEHAIDALEDEEQFPHDRVLVHLSLRTRKSQRPQVVKLALLCRGACHLIGIAIRHVRATAGGSRNRILLGSIGHLIGKF